MTHSGENHCIKFNAKLNVSTSCRMSNKTLHYSTLLCKCYTSIQYLVVLRDEITKVSAVLFETTRCRETVYIQSNIKGQVLCQMVTLWCLIKVELFVCTSSLCLVKKKKHQSDDKSASQGL